MADGRLRRHGVTPPRKFQVLGGLFAGGEDTGLAGYSGLTNGVNTTMGHSARLVTMNGSRTGPQGWLKFYVGATAVWLPYWVTIT